MSEAAFVDSSGWYALIDRRDDAHSLAANTVAQLIREGVRLITTDYVIDESCTLARIRAGAGAARALLEVLDTTRALTVEWIGPDRFDAAKALFRRQLDRGFSFTDCTSFVVMDEQRIRDALTTDSHFVTRGFQALLRAPSGR